MACTKICVFFFLMALLMGTSTATLYYVGDSAGWNSKGTDYQSWASKKTFYGGDGFVFKYERGTQTVVQVTREGYKSCSTTDSIDIFDSGMDSIFLFEPGDYYYISGYPSTCQKGQKVMIELLHTSKPNPTPVPNITVPTPPGGTPERDPRSFYWSSGAACAALNLHHHLGIAIFASLFALTFFYLH